MTLERVSVRREMRSEPDLIWKAICDIEQYPRFMDSVLEVTVLADDPVEGRLAQWSIELKGSILRWRERGKIDYGQRRIRFEQVDGDLKVFRGAWSLERSGSATHVAALEVEFEIGIPLLASMLTPVAVRTLRDNALSMLRQLDERAAAGEAHG